jgi:hypothetical protein
MSKHRLVVGGSTRRSFLRTTLVGGAGLAVSQFARPAQLLASGSYSQSIGASSDDAQEATNGDVKIITPNLSLKDRTAQWVGLRFTNVPIPPATAIKTATLTLNLVIAPTVATQFIGIYGELPTSGNSATFVSATNNISSRPRTGNQTTWLIPNTTGLYSISTNNPGWSGAVDLWAIIQAIVNNNWMANNALSLIISNNSSALNAAVEAWDAGGMSPPKLDITW